MLLKVLFSILHEYDMSHANLCICAIYKYNKYKVLIAYAKVQFFILLLFLHVLLFLCFCGFFCSIVQSLDKNSHPMMVCMWRDTVKKELENLFKLIDLSY